MEIAVDTPTVAHNVAMAASPISPIAPARIRALVVPVDRLRRSRFDSFVDRLCSEHVIRLGDISPDQRPDRSPSSSLEFGRFDRPC